MFCSKSRRNRQAFAALNRDKAAEKHHSLSTSDCRLTVWPTPSSGRPMTRPEGSKKVLAWDVEQAAPPEPEHDVAAPVPAGHAPDPAGGEEDDATGLRQILGDLAAALGAANHQHRSRRERRRMAVVGRVHLHQMGGQGAGHRRAAWAVQAAAGDHHVAHPSHAPERVEAVSPLFLVEGEFGDRGVGLDRQ